MLFLVNRKNESHGIQRRRVGSIRLGDQAAFAPEGEFRGAGEFFERAARGTGQDRPHSGKRGEQGERGRQVQPCGPACGERQGGADARGGAEHERAVLLPADAVRDVEGDHGLHLRG